MIDAGHFLPNGCFGDLSCIAAVNVLRLQANAAPASTR
jgi:hypothetical protein